MKHSTYLIILSLIPITSQAMGAAPDAPNSVLAQKGALIFSDDFSRSELGDLWHSAIPAFTVTGDALKGSQARDDHGAAISAIMKLPDGNVILELKFRFDGANSMNVGLDDLRIWSVKVN